MYIRLNIKYLRKLKKLTQKQISDDLDIKRTTYTNYELGISSPDIDTSRKIAAYYNVNMEHLLNLDISKLGEYHNFGNDIDLNDVSKKNNVKIYDINAFAGLVENIQQSEVLIGEFYLPDLSGEHLAMTVFGNSMESTILEGDLVILKKITSSDEIKHNSIYLIVYDGMPLIKRIQLLPDMILLKSDNSFYPIIPVDKEKIISIFKVVKLLRDF